MPTLRARPPFIGVDTQSEPSELSTAHATSALNANLDNGTLKKRPGYTEKFDAGGSAIQGIFDFRRNDGSVDTLVKHGDELHTWNGSVLAEIDATLSLSATELASFGVYGDRCYICDGTNLKVTDASTVEDAEITRPDISSMTAATGSAGNLTGEYDYKITYYSSTWGQESPASDATAVITADADQIDLGSIPASADSRVDLVRIYRRKVSRNETLWFFVAEQADTTSTYTDDTIDQNVSNTDIAPLSYTSSLPGFRHLLVHSGVMFLAGDDHQLFYTLPEKPWSVTNSTSIGGEGAFGKITGLASFKGLLFVFKEDSIWTVSGLTEDSFHARVVVEGIGCYGGHSIVQTDTLIYFLGEDGFYAFDGSEAIRISRPIQPDILARNRSRDKYVVGVDYEEHQAIVWTYSSSGAAANDKVFAFFYGNTVRTEGQQSWCPWEFDSALTFAARVTTDATTRDRKVWYGFANGVVGQEGGNADNATDIEFHWRTAKWDGGVPMRLKKWGTFQHELQEQTNYSYAAWRYYRDAETDFEVFDEPDPREPIHEVRISDSSRDLRLEIYEKSQEPFEAIGFELGATLGGLA